VQLSPPKTALLSTELLPPHRRRCCINFNAQMTS